MIEFTNLLFYLQEVEKQEASLRMRSECTWYPARK
jgi:hypothetical protein